MKKKRSFIISIYWSQESSRLLRVTGEALFLAAQEGIPGQAGEPELSDWRGRGKPAYQDGLITR